jgi:hypothetical protein
MIGSGEPCTSSITFHRGAGLHQPDIEHTKPHPLERRRHVAGRDTLGEALDDGRFADAGLAGQDRIVLTAPHQDIDELTDLVVASENRVHLAGLGLGGQVLRIAIERRRPLGLRGSSIRTARGADAGAIDRLQVLLFGPRPDPTMSRGQRIGIQLGELLGDAVQRAANVVRFQAGNKDVAGPDLGLAEE